MMMIGSHNTLKLNETGNLQHSDKRAPLILIDSIRTIYILLVVRLLGHMKSHVRLHQECWQIYMG